MNEGLIDADLGAGLFKKRIAIPGQGKRGGWRSLLGFQAGRNPALRQSSCLTWWIEKALKQLRDPQISKATAQLRVKKV